MKRAMPWGDGNEVILSSDDDDDDDDDDNGDSSSSSSLDADMGVKDGSDEITPAIKALDVHPTKQLTPEEMVSRRAEMYQEYMKKIPIPSLHGSAIPFTTWQGLAKSIKQLYGQPLHYLTNSLLKQWDKSRMGSDDEHLPLDSIIHPRKAEATIWLMEEAHRLTSSHHHLAQLWLSDPMHHAFIDAIFPQI